MIEQKRLALHAAGRGLRLPAYRLVFGTVDLLHIDGFEERTHIAVAALKALADEGAIDRKIVGRAIEKYGIAVDRPNPWDV